MVIDHASSLYCRWFINGFNMDDAGGWGMISATEKWTGYYRPDFVVRLPLFCQGSRLCDVPAMVLPGKRPVFLV
jgi:hypothetical protein